MLATFMQIAEVADVSCQHLPRLNKTSLGMPAQAPCVAFAKAPISKRGKFLGSSPYC